MKRLLALAAVLALFGAACSSDDSSETTTSAAAETTTTDPDVEAAFSAFCESATTYVDDLDQFTGLFGDSSASLTVGQIKEGSATLDEDADAVQKDADALEKAIDDYDKVQKDNEAKEEESSGTTSTTVVSIDVDDGTIERVQQAQDDFDAAVEGISDDTPVSAAEVEFQSAAYALEVSWMTLLTEAGCLEEDQQALDDIKQFTAGLQTDLTALGVFTGKIDGIYGPDTVTAVEAFQKEVGLPETGLPDPATQKAINEKLAANEAMNVSALQGMLKGLGLYDGPINGQYDEATENSVKLLQAELGVPETGVMDPPTWEAYANRRKGLEELLAAAKANATSTTTAAPAPTAAPTTADPATTTEAPTTTAAP
ncbi:MAG: peptidoglycan-binding domain-containing protein [Microthrixaceae bacterium]